MLKGDLVADTEREKEESQTNLENTIAVGAKPVENVKEEPKQEKNLGGLFRRFTKEPEKPKQEEQDFIKQAYEDKENVIAQVYANKFSVQEESTPYELPTNGGVNEKLIADMNQLENLKVDNTPENFDEMYIRTFGTMPSDVRKAAAEEKAIEKAKEEKITVNQDEMQAVENISIFPKEEEKQIPSYKFIGIAFSTYIILELGKELYILDQHAAHERILYEKVKKNYNSEAEKDSQLMLLPDIINLSHKEMDIARENMELFRKAGFTLEEFGENTIKLSGVPNICLDLDLDTKELFLETLDEINTVARTAKQEIEEKFLSTIACKAAVKANMALTKEEVDKLMSSLLVLPNPFTCPHGRPTAIKMTKTDIEKKFSRR